MFEKLKALEDNSFYVLFGFAAYYHELSSAALAAQLEIHA